MCCTLLTLSGTRAPEECLTLQKAQALHLLPKGSRCRRSLEASGLGHSFCAGQGAGMQLRRQRGKPRLYNARNPFGRQCCRRLMLGRIAASFRPIGTELVSLLASVLSLCPALPQGCRQFGLLFLHHLETIALARALSILYMVDKAAKLLQQRTLKEASHGALD